MEFPISVKSDVKVDNTCETTKSFLDNEKGGASEIVTSKKNVRDNITEFSANEVKDVTVEGNDVINGSALNGNNIEPKNLKLSEKEFDEDKIVSNINDLEREKFNNLNCNHNSDGNDFKISETIAQEGKKKLKDAVDVDEENKSNAIIDSNNSQPHSSGSPLDEEKSEKPDKEEWMDILGTGQLKKKTIKSGTPDTRPQKSDVCKISVVGRLENGTVFEKHECLVINLGDNETVQGLDFALALMDNGEEAEVVIASRFGYGSLGNLPLVPPDATLNYHITLIDVQPEPVISDLEIGDRFEIGCRKKERGNWWYSRDEHTLAIHSYRRALDYLDDTDIPGEHTEEQVNKLLEERLKTYNNLGMSQMKISAYDAALLSIEKVLNCQPKNVKALFRKSKILKEKGELTKSIEILRQVLAIEPDTKSFQQELSLLLAAQRLDNTKQRDLYKKMMGRSLQDNDADKKNKAPYNTMKWVAAISFAVAVIGTLAFKYRL